LFVVYCFVLLWFLKHYQIGQTIPD
jgi:hypothetical protein